MQHNKNKNDGVTRAVLRPPFTEKFPYVQHLRHIILTKKEILAASFKHEEDIISNKYWEGDYCWHDEDGTITPQDVISNPDRQEHNDRFSPIQPARAWPHQHVLTGNLRKTQQVPNLSTFWLASAKLTTCVWKNRPQACGRPACADLRHSSHFCIS